MVNDGSPTPTGGTALVAHQLQAPLIALRARLQSALDAFWCNDECEGLIRECLDQVQSMGQLIVDVLLLERAEAGRLAGRPGLIDLARLAGEVARELKPVAEEKGLELQLSVDLALPVVGDESQLRRLLVNLIHNAIQYTSRRGIVQVEGLRTSSSAEIRVRDTGIGIPPEEIPRIFESFYQVDPQRSRPHGSVGLGLPIARALAEINGGSIEVSSTMDKGSCFALKLPLNKS